MIHAYDEMYLANARKIMAGMLDYAVHHYRMKLVDYYELFRASSVSRRFASGDCAVIAGRSGAELAAMVLEECGADILMKARGADEAGAGSSDGRSIEYWTGWALAYYQWRSGLSFDRIERFVPIDEIRNMYMPYHEMDILRFCDEMTKRITDKQSAKTRLRYYRDRIGMSQSQLANAADIPVRTIQQYEQKQKNINRASGEYLLRLSQALHCSQQDLMEQHSR